MNEGYFGKVLWVDLTNESLQEETLPEEIYRKYLGGYGLACRLIYENMEADVDPLSADSILGFFPGLLTGTMAPYSGRYIVAGKSPLTGTWGDANSGGTFGPEIKKCGYDGILIKGIAESPKYLVISPEKQEILDASDIWGLDIIEAEKKLKEKHGRFIKTAGIGQAGENLSLISGIANDGGRIAARSGLGAIMGSKKFKMLVLKGKERIKYHERKKYISLVQEYNKEAKQEDPGWLLGKIIKIIPNMAKLMRRVNMGMEGPPKLIRKIYHNVGTCIANTLSAETGDSPVKNWGGIGMYDFPLEMSSKISSNEILKYKVKDYGCYSCPVQCGGIMNVPELDLEHTHQPEYETCCAFGTDLLNNDILSLFEINELCNRAAIDTISTGATVAFAIECYENGILSKDDTGDLELTWGNSDAIINLVKKIINREGIGDILADGADIAAEKIGKGSQKYAMTSLGQELPMHNPRSFKSLGFSYAYDPTPGRHTTASVDFMEIGDLEVFIKGFKYPKNWKDKRDKKAKAQKFVTAVHQVVNCLGLCNFSTLFGEYPLIGLINSLTGWKLDIDDIINIGLRIQTIRQAFTLREGVEIAKNELPGRVVGNPPDERGPHEGKTIEYKEFYELYCKAMGWNPDNGYPLQKSLKDLDLEIIIKDLY
ncbi:MAG: aldehyde ferredoxin oxidoreductase [Promethearchaeota archaeon]|nr:MAG: aldehyde ferredoxin oxidoreductase [Candidatus Lokiarchaeota archaeon]